MGKRADKYKSGDRNDRKSAKLRKLEEWDLEEVDLELEEHEDVSVPDGDADGKEADGKKEPRPLSAGALIGIFLVMALLSSIICAVIWRFVHGDRQDAPNSEPVAALTWESGITDMESDTYIGKYQR